MANETTGKGLISKICKQPKKQRPNQKVGKRPKCKTINYKVLRGKLRTLHDVNQSKILYDPPPRVKEIKIIVNKRDLIKLKSFCTAKESISKVRRQPS